ncbi:Fc.00g076410.m01.CDS01 [Cosmosporella sp. VM-42]
MATYEPVEPVFDLRDLDGVDEPMGASYESIIKDQDDAEAVLQPAISAAASHLTSCNTPAIEKAAALEKHRGVVLDVPSDGDGETSPDLDEPPERKYQAHGIPRLDVPTDELPSGQLSRDSLPSPWQAGPKQLVFQDTPSRPSKGVLESAFGPTRNRSRSAGQEALKRLQKAFPSLSSPSHLLPSLPSSFFSNFGDKASSRPNNIHRHSSSIPNRSSRSDSAPVSSQGPRRPPLAAIQASVASPASGSTSRPPYLRRVTSDDSLLYHTLSRTSSLGDDDQFHDVREMVNMRFMALKDSLPDVPNFKMPSLPKMYGQSRKSTQSLNTYSTEAVGSQPNVVREPTTSAKDPSTALDRVLENLEGDIVVMGGYRGSILRSAEAPHQQLWAPVKLGLNMRKANLEVGLEDKDEEEMEKTIIPSGMLKHIGPIDVSRKFLKKLRSCDNARTGKLRVWDYGYDWRLSPTLLSRKLQEFLQKLPSNRPGTPAESRGALVIAHSLGGLITRHAVNQRPNLFSGVLYAGVPQRCINILGPIRNGDVVLLNEKLLTAHVNFSMRTSFVFLPEDGFCFVDKNTGESYPIDFYDPQEWVKWALSPCVQPALPAFNRQQSSSLSSFIPNSLRARSDSKSEKLPPSPTAAKDRTIAPQMDSGTHQKHDPSPSDPERERYLAYLTRTLAMIRKFRSELAHDPLHQEANAYPPLAIMYGKTIPTVYAAQVNGREAIPCADAYDDLLFRAGDGVVLAKEAMPPEGYSIVRGGRICTERGHITMLGDMPAVGRALEALLRGRRKGIGFGGGDDTVRRR